MSKNHLKSLSTASPLSPAQQQKQSTQNNHSRRLLEFIQQKRAKENHLKQKDMIGNGHGRKCVSQTKLESNNKREKAINSNDATNRNSNDCSNSSRITCPNGNGNGNNSKNKSSVPTSKSISQAGNKSTTPFVPSKRSIQHHDYSNINDVSHTTQISKVPAAANIYDSATVHIKNGTYKSASAATNRTNSAPSFGGETCRDGSRAPPLVYNCTADNNRLHEKRYDDNNNDTSNNKHSHHGNRLTCATAGLTMETAAPFDNRKHNNNGINRDGSSAPIYRRFGDTNLLRHNGKSKVNYNVLTASSDSTSTTTSTALCVDQILPMPNQHNNGKKAVRNYAQDDTIERYLPTMKQRHHQHDSTPAKHINKQQSQNHAPAANDKQNRLINGDIFRLSKNHYITCSMTNDTGFSSMDPDNASTVAPTTKITQNHYYSPFNQIHCINYDVKNRIRMFDVDSSSSSYRPKCHNNYKSSANPHDKR